MSHLPERKEKNCLNCGTNVVGKYCHECGQENVEPKETAWQLISHFFSDITHFDGKFFSSLKHLVLKPGFLPKEYMLGKRASYLNPVRMYLFTSAIFFLVFFSLYTVDENSFQIADNIDKIDSVQLKELSAGINNGKPLTKEQIRKKLDPTGIHFMWVEYKSKKEYDSILKAGIKKDNWLERMITYRGIELNEKYHNKARLALTTLLGKVQHSIPQMLFVLLPVFAIFLKLLYSRHKNFYYTDHAIFTIHFYIFVFIQMLLIFGISKIESKTGAGWLQYVNLALVFVIFFYLYKAMRNFYGQGRIKTILKYLLLLLSFSCFGFFLFIIFFLISVFKI